MERAETLAIELKGARLPADLVMPEAPRGVVVFAHGSGSSRLSVRNRAVASRLRSGGRFGTLLFDLLTPQEDLLYANRFEIGLLAKRLVSVAGWLSTLPETYGLPLGLFGASTGAAAALAAAAELGPRVRAVVSRGGRPDLAGEALRGVTQPTLLIVGGYDTQVVAMNEDAMRHIPVAETRLEIVPGATHLFEEPGAIEEVARLALEWFDEYLGAGR